MSGRGRPAAPVLDEIRARSTVNLYEWARKDREALLAMVDERAAEIVRLRETLEKVRDYDPPEESPDDDTVPLEHVANLAREALKKGEP